MEYGRSMDWQLSSQECVRNSAEVRRKKSLTSSGLMHEFRGYVSWKVKQMFLFYSWQKKDC